MSYGPLDLSGKVAVVIGGTSGQANTGVLSFFTQEGNPLNLTLTPR